MIIDRFDTDKHVLIVAEIGNNHEGSVDLAHRLVDLAAAAGAGAVKFQTFRTEHYVSRRDRDRFARLKSYELDPTAFSELAVHAREQGLLFLSTPFDLASVQVLAPLVDAYKVASGDNTFIALLKAVAEPCIPVILSSGLATMDTLRAAVDLVRRTWAGCGHEGGLAVLHCVSSYPVPPEQAALGAIPRLREALNCTIGYSDHTMGLEAALVAVALGARIVEKHFTVDRDYSDFRDHRLSADPDELRRLVERVEQVQTLIGSGEEDIQPCEQAGLPGLRRSIAAGEDLAAGTVVEMKHLTWVRPGLGLPPGEEDRVVGRTLARSVSAGDPLLPEHLVDGTDA